MKTKTINRIAYRPLMWKGEPKQDKVIYERLLKLGKKISRMSKKGESAVEWLIKGRR